MIVNFDQYGKYEVPQLILCEPESTYIGAAINVTEMPEPSVEQVNRVVRYTGDSTAEYTSGVFYRCDPVDDGEGGTDYVWTPIGTVGNLTAAIGEIPYVTDVEAVFNFNDISTVNFRVHLPNDEIKNFSIAKRMYDSVLKHRYVFVQDFGYFRIEDVKSTSTESEKYKDVSASSCEIEIRNRGIPYIADGAYTIFEILELLQKRLPYWSISVTSADKDIFENEIGKRAFLDVDVKKKIYDFMVEDMQKAFDCVFIFDPMARIINVRAKSAYTYKTDIHLTYTDLINSVTADEENIGAYSAMSGYGDDDLNFSAINPLGSNVVYNLSYYTHWMDGELEAKVNAWSLAVSSLEDDYYIAAVEYYEKMEELYEATAEYNRLSKQLSVYQQCYDNVIKTNNASSADYFNNELESIGVDDSSSMIQITTDVQDTIQQLTQLISDTTGDVNTAYTDMTNIEQDAENMSIALEAMRHTVAIDSYFTRDELCKLSNYIYEGTFSDENIIVTDIMTVAEKMSEMKKLYDETKLKLSRVAYPALKFDIDVDSFIFVNKFSHLTSQLQTGHTVCVEYDYGQMLDVFVMKIEINYEDAKCRMTFSNSMKRNDIKSLFEDVFKDITVGGSSFGYV